MSNTSGKSDMFDGKLFFLQTYAALPGKADEFRRLFSRSFAPLLEKRGLRKAAFWETSQVEGPSGEHLALWEFSAPSEMIGLTRALDAPDGDQELQAVRDDLSLLVSRQEGWTYLGSGQSLGIADMRREGITLKNCLWEQVDIVPNQYALFENALRVDYLRLIRDSGIRLVGVYRPQLFSIKATVLWDLEDFSCLSRLDEIDDSAALRHWGNIALTFRTAVSGRLLRAI